MQSSNTNGSNLFLVANEDKIYLDRCAVDNSQASNEIYEVNKYLKLDENIVNGASPVEIIKDATKFETLYNNAMSLYTNEVNFLTALRIKLGWDGDYIKLIYQPILTIRTSVLSVDEKIAKYDLIKEGNNFVYDLISKDFIVASQDQMNYIQNYKSNMKILRNYADEIHTKYIQGVDTEYVTFTFNEIQDMITDNLPNKRHFIFNCIKSYSNDPIASIKNSLIFSPNVYPRSEKDFGPFKDMYGNLAHLCPPNCKSFLYKMAVL